MDISELHSSYVRDWSINRARTPSQHIVAPVQLADIHKQQQQQKVLAAK